MPSMPGIMTSSKHDVGLGALDGLSRASTPFMAVTTSKYSADSFASSRRTLARMSSTTRTLGGHCVALEETVHVCRKLITEIGFEM